VRHLGASWNSPQARPPCRWGQNRN